MEKKCYAWFLRKLRLPSILAALLIAASCAGAPPVEEPPPAPPPVETPPAPQPEVQRPDQAALNALDAAAARAEAARKLADDFDGGSFFPSDWQSADALLSQAERGKNTSTLRDVRDSAARYNTAADAFEALSAKAIAQYYENRQKELLAARAVAVEAGAQTLAPDFLLDADEASAGALEKYLSKDYYAAKDAAGNALLMYNVIATGLKANEARQAIADRGFEVYDPINIAAADENFKNAVMDYSGKNYAAAKEKADSALSFYTLALENGWEAYAAERGAFAASARQNALDMKANVAVRQDFDTAQIAYTQANTAFGSRRYEDAAALFARCESMFAETAASALEKRLAAEEALRLANEKIAESDETAKNAEVILEGSME